MRKLFALFTSVLLLVSCVAAISVSALAQSQANSGNIEGRVIDPNGAAVAGATVTATNQQTGLEKSSTSSDEGLFRIRSEEHTSELQSPCNLVCRPLLEKKKTQRERHR